MALKDRIYYFWITGTQVKCQKTVMGTISVEQTQKSLSDTVIFDSHGWKLSFVDGNHSVVGRVGLLDDDFILVDHVDVVDVSVLDWRHKFRTSRIEKVSGAGNNLSGRVVGVVVQSWTRKRQKTFLVFYDFIAFVDAVGQIVIDSVISADTVNIFEVIYL